MINLKKGSSTAILSLVIVTAILLTTVYASMLSQNGNSNREVEVTNSTSSTEAVAETTTQSNDNMVGVWVPYMTLDMSSSEDKSEEAFKSKFDTIVSNSKQYGATALVVQIRAFSDALYPSNYFPYSYLSTGTQGQDPGYDPLKYMIEATHNSGMEFHAWINPYRIQSKSVPAQLADNNMYNVWRNDSNPDNDDYVVDYDGGKYYNPAYPEVQQLIVDGVSEVVKNYDVDAIHFDDYFYPSGADASFDEKAYNTYLSTAGDAPLELSEFRKNNVNILVQNVYNTIKSINPNVEFGISPQANIANDDRLGADVCTWCQTSGYIDYICPQIYYNFENSTLPFNTAADQWNSLVTCPNVDLYFGLALYKAGSSTYDNGTWLSSDNIIQQQIQYSDSIGINDFMLYSYDYLINDETSNEVANAKTALDAL